MNRFVSKRTIFIFSTILLSILVSTQVITAQRRGLRVSSTNNQVERLPEQQNIVGLQTVLRSIATNVTPGVVSIEIEGGGVPANMANDPFFQYFFGNSDALRKQYNFVGSGFIITPDGYLFSNWHVVEGAEHIRVTLADGQSYAAELVGADTELDIALLKIDAKNLPVVPIGNSDNVQVGDLVVAIGNPFGLSGSFTFGAVSGLGREGILPGLQTFIQSDVAVNPGNSGGPLINIKGQAIGINTAIRSQSGGYEGISFAVPINIARSVAEQLFSTGMVERGFLGIVPQEIDNITRQSLGIPQNLGILVSSLDERGPAGKADIRQGDIITKLDGANIAKPSELTEKIASKAPKSTVNLQIIREGKTINKVVTLGTRPSALVRGGQQQNDNNNAESLASSVEFNGVRFAAPSDQDLRSSGATKGVVVVSVQPDSPLALILSRGDIVAAVNNRPTPDIETFQSVADLLSNQRRFAFAIYKNGYLVYRSIEF